MLIDEDARRCYQTCSKHVGTKQIALVIDWLRAALTRLRAIIFGGGRSEIIEDRRLPQHCLRICGSSHAHPRQIRICHMERVIALGSFLVAHSQAKSFSLDKQRQDFACTNESQRMGLMTNSASICRCIAIYMYHSSM